ncbi:MAG: hypothetical protein J07HQX50_00972 [Haloquadratum sp. J07HQX50]|jgi:hypothetical protein|nr:MAG: hypothetical protein J07HQX50_00972 [Haloquadratum sp. J07HQX50]
MHSGDGEWNRTAFIRYYPDEVEFSKQMCEDLVSDILLSKQATNPHMTRPQLFNLTCLVRA